MRRDVAAAIIGIGGPQIRQRLGTAPLPIQHPTQAIENGRVSRRRLVRALDQLARLANSLSWSASVNPSAFMAAGSSGRAFKTSDNSCSAAPTCP